jgi:hypothetical protein
MAAEPFGSRFSAAAFPWLNEKDQRKDRTRPRRIGLEHHGFNLFNWHFSVVGQALNKNWRLND